MRLSGKSSEYFTAGSSKIAVDDMYIFIIKKLNKLIKLISMFALVLGTVSAMAVIEIAPLSTAELEARYRLLIEELRCPKCQNQNLSDSDSPIAADLREQIRVLLEEGKSDQEVVAYLVDRYGDFVRYRPAVQPNTLVLWFAPAVFAVLALVAVFFVVRGHQRAKSRVAELSLEEQRRLDSLLSSPPKSGDKHL